MSRTENGFRIVAWKSLQLTSDAGNAALVSQMGPVGIAAVSLTNLNGTATFTTAAPHGFTDKQQVQIDGANDAAYNIYTEITVLSPTVFTYLLLAVPAVAFGQATAASLKSRQAIIQADPTNAGTVSIGPSKSVQSATLAAGQGWAIPETRGPSGEMCKFDLNSWYFKGSAVAQKLNITYLSIAFLLFFFSLSSNAAGPLAPYLTAFSAGVAGTNKDAASWRAALGVSSGGGAATNAIANTNGVGYSTTLINPAATNLSVFNRGNNAGTSFAPVQIFNLGPINNFDNTATNDYASIQYFVNNKDEWLYFGASGTPTNTGTGFGTSTSLLGIRARDSFVYAPGMIFSENGLVVGRFGSTPSTNTVINPDGSQTNTGPFQASSANTTGGMTVGGGQTNTGTVRFNGGFVFATGAGAGKVLQSDLNGNMTLQTPAAGGVTSVAQTVPSEFSVAGSPITTSGTLAVTYKVPTTLTFSGTIATDATANKKFRLVATSAFTLSNPTGASDGDELSWEIKQDGTGGRVLTLDTKFAGGTDITLPITLTATANKTDILKVRYNSSADKFWVTGIVKGY